MPEDRVRPSQIQRIPPGRDLSWIRELYQFVERIPEYFVMNEIRHTAPFPGTSRFTENELETLGDQDVGDGTDLTLTLPAPVRGTLRQWVALSLSTTSTTGKDAELGFTFNAQVFRLVTDNAMSQDDSMSLLNFLCCSGMVVRAFVRQATIGESYTLVGMHVDYPEGEVQSFPTIVTSVAG